MKEYTKLSALVHANGYWRIFETQSFTIRTIVNMLNRYCGGEYEIVRVKEGEFKCPCPNWTKDYQLCEEDNLLPIAEYSREELLQIFDFRTAINIWYTNCAKTYTYPSKNPFKGVRIWAREEFPYPIKKFGWFLADKDNPDGPNILKYFEGKRISRVINTVDVDGYYLTAPRIKDFQTNTDEESE